MGQCQPEVFLSNVVSSVELCMTKSNVIPWAEAYTRRCHDGKQVAVLGCGQADFGHTFKLFIEFGLKIDGFEVPETKYHMEIAPE